MICPEGHESTEADYCSVCGTPMVSPPGQSAFGTRAPQPPAPQQPEAARQCPVCGARAAADAFFCDTCGYDFLTGSLPRGAGDEDVAPASEAAATTDEPEDAAAPPVAGEQDASGEQLPEADAEPAPPVVTTFDLDDGPGHGEVANPLVVDAEPQPSVRPRRSASSDLLNLGEPQRDLPDPDDLRPLSVPGYQSPPQRPLPGPPGVRPPIPRPPGVRSPGPQPGPGPRPPLGAPPRPMPPPPARSGGYPPPSNAGYVPSRSRPPLAPGQPAQGGEVRPLPGAGQPPRPQPPRQQQPQPPRQPADRPEPAPQTGRQAQAGPAVPEAPVSRPVQTGPGALPGPDGPARWVAEIWIDPEWYRVQQAPEQLPSPGQPVVQGLRKRTLVIGRSSPGVRPDLDCLTDTGVSRRQAALTTDGSRWFLEDLGSSNGTYVGQVDQPMPTQPISGRVELGLHDRIYVGSWTRIVVRPALVQETGL